MGHPDGSTWPLAEHPARRTNQPCTRCRPREWCRTPARTPQRANSCSSRRSSRY